MTTLPYMTALSNSIALQLARLQALPQKMHENPLRTAMLDGIQRRNALLDGMFYDVATVREDELPLLAFWLAREGALLIVPPSGDEKLQVFLEIDEFLEAGGRDVKALAVAGVGSSAVGAAAFARNVADALGGPVAAVVSGYGLSDLMTEALGGFFWFGGLNSIRHAFEGFDQATRAFTLAEPLPSSASSMLLERVSKDTATLIALLEDETFMAPLLIGHSKGNLVISEALYALEFKNKAAALADRCQIITISAKVGMPSAFVGKVFDIIGQWDAFGALNSRPDIPADYVVPGAWHSTNPDFPMNMGINVPHVLRTVLPLLDLVPPPPVHAVPNLIFDTPQRGVGAAAALSSRMPI